MLVEQERKAAEQRKAEEQIQRRKKFLKEVFENILKYVSVREIYIPFAEEQAYYPAYTTLIELILEADIYQLSTEEKWDLLLKERAKIIPASTFEINWRREEYLLFCQLHHKRVEIKNNYFAFKALENTKIEVFKQFLNFIAKESINKHNEIIEIVNNLIEYKL